MKRHIALLFCTSLALAAGVCPSPNRARAQSASDLRHTHERAVFATVRIRAGRASGSGWLLAQSGRPLVVTNRHVAAAAHRYRVYFYRGASSSAEHVGATRFHIARDIDLAILQLSADPPASVRPVQLRTDTQVVRGERVVLGGNPVDDAGAVLPFQTTEGVVTGHVSGNRYDHCGRGRNCVVIDAASFRGSSGGPAFNVQGELVGMIWGGPVQVALRGRQAVAAVHTTSFSYLIHTSTIAAELQRLEHQ